MWESSTRRTFLSGVIALPALAGLLAPQHLLTPRRPARRRCTIKRRQTAACSAPGVSFSSPARTQNRTALARSLMDRFHPTAIAWPSRPNRLNLQPRRQRLRSPLVSRQFGILDLGRCRYVLGLTIPALTSGRRNRTKERWCGRRRKRFGHRAEQNGVGHDASSGERENDGHSG